MKQRESLLDGGVSRLGLAARPSCKTSVRIRFGSPFSSNVLVCGHCLIVTSSLTVNETLKMALIATDLNAGVVLLVTV